MKQNFNVKENIKKTKKLIDYVDIKNATPETYKKLGFRCGLEIHQQLRTEKKLFCRCPARIYQKDNEYDAELIRHMRPTLSELGEYDGTALMEFKTKKDIIYHINYNTACTYDIDDTPPFRLNRNALQIAIEIALLLKTSIVGELHITRKQYLDGSIPTGFQRTGIIGIEGNIKLSKKNIRIIQLSLEEDACREVSDIGHTRVYTTDRLGIPLVETVTYPDLKNPEEAAEAAHYIRFLTRSTGKVRTGIGAAREDVNVSITGGSRVEIKGVAHIKWIPTLTHNEAFRQKALLEIKKILKNRISNSQKWHIKSTQIPPSLNRSKFHPVIKTKEKKIQIHAINLPGFRGILSSFTQPNKTFANELSDRLKVISCIEKPNMIHSESLKPTLNNTGFNDVKKILNSKEKDAQLIIWGSKEDMGTALETIEERCRLAFIGVPNETRKGLKDGTTIFERVLPGPDRMYPDTDSAPIPIQEETIENIKKQLPSEISYRIKKMKNWKIPEDTFEYILKKNLFSIIEKIIEDFNYQPSFVGTIFGHHLRHLSDRFSPPLPLNNKKIYNLFAFVFKKKLHSEILKPMFAALSQNPDMDFNTLLTAIGYKKVSEKKITSQIDLLKKKFNKIYKSNNKSAEISWIMGQIRPLAIGNISLQKLRQKMIGGKNE